MHQEISQYLDSNPLLCAGQLLCQSPTILYECWQCRSPQGTLLLLGIIAPALMGSCSDTEVTAWLEHSDLFIFPFLR